jgi:hypothetical protein
MGLSFGDFKVTRKYKVSLNRFFYYKFCSAELLYGNGIGITGWIKE